MTTTTSPVSKDMVTLMEACGLDETTHGGMLKTAGIVRPMHLKTISLQDIKLALESGTMGTGDIGIVVAMATWYSEWFGTPAPKDIFAVHFTEAKFETFMEKWDPSMGTTTGPPATTPATVSGATTASAKVSPLKFKLDLKDIPKFEKGRPIAEQYTNWEESFLVAMDLVNIGDVLVDSWVTPTDPDEIEQSEAKMGIIRAALMKATLGTNAYAHVDSTLTGREIFMALRTIYTGTDAAEEKALEAAVKMQKLMFTAKSSFTAEKFVSDYKECLKIMKQNGTAYPESLIVGTFLNKVVHPEFDNFRQMYESPTCTATFDETITAFMKRAKALATNGSTNRVNRVANNGSGQNGNRNNQGGNKQHADYIPKEKWKKMSKAEKQDFLKKRKAQPATSSNLQYGGQSTNANTNHVTSNTVHSDAATVPVDNTSSNKHRMNNMMAQVNATPTSGGSYCTRTMTVHISSTLSATMSHQSANSKANFVSTLCMDSGTNISAMGRAFFITEKTHRVANLTGFADGLEKLNVPICSGVATYEYNGKKLLIGIHEAPYLEHNSSSLLCIGQAREHGVLVDDLMIRHGGKQRLVVRLDGVDHAIPLSLRDGLLHVDLRYPTTDELDSLPILWLTSDVEPWDPSVMNDDASVILPAVDEEALQGLIHGMNLSDVISQIECAAHSNEWIGMLTVGVLTLATWLYTSVKGTMLHTKGIRNP
jgi:hypothetical protein